MHTLQLVQRQHRQINAIGRQAQAPGNGMDAWQAALHVAIVEGQMLGRRVRLAHLAQQQGATHRQRRLLAGRLVDTAQHVLPQIHAGRVISALGHPEQGFQLRQQPAQSTTGAQHPQHP
jgi:hypothetical protein